MSLTAAILCLVSYTAHGGLTYSLICVRACVCVVRTLEGLDKMKFLPAENWSWCRSAVTTKILTRNNVIDSVAYVRVIGNTSGRGLRKKETIEQLPLYKLLAINLALETNPSVAWDFLRQ